MEIELIYFIHIPKNCGTTIKGLIHDQSLEGVIPHDHGYDPFKLNPEKSMFILRDPIDRFLSSFYYSGLYPTCALMLARDKIKNPVDLVKALMDDESNEQLLATKHHTIGDRHLKQSWIWTPQHYWDNGAKYVLFQDNISEDFKDFLDITGRRKINLPQLNKCRSRREVSFSEDEEKFLKKRYEKDYEIIEKYKKYEWKNTG